MRARESGGGGGPLPFHKVSSRRLRDGQQGGEGEVEAAAAHVQRIFRTRRHDSRRRAALAIERFYLQRRRSPPHARADDGGAGVGGSPTLALASPLLSSLSASGTASPLILGGAALGPQPLAPLPEAEVDENSMLGLEDGELFVPSAHPSPQLAWAGNGRPPGASAGHHSPPARSGVGSHEPSPLVGERHSAASAALVRQAQVAFRTRHARRKAVRVIESAWQEWQYHSEQAKLAAHDAESAHFHAYHAERRERAARVIQGYLQRQQQAGGEDGSGLDPGVLPDGTRDRGTTGTHPRDQGLESPMYSSAELEMLRRVQRAFRAHVKSQAEEAEEALKEARSASQSANALGGGGRGQDEYGRLCAILRRCTHEGINAANLSREEQAVLVALQQAVRTNLERKRRQQPVESGLALAPPAMLPTVTSERDIEAMAEAVQDGEL